MCLQFKQTQNWCCEVLCDMQVSHADTCGPAKSHACILVVLVAAGLRVTPLHTMRRHRSSSSRHVRQTSAHPIAAAVASPPRDLAQPSDG